MSKLLALAGAVLLLAGCAAIHPRPTIVAAAPQEHELRADQPDEAARYLRNRRWPHPGRFPVERYLAAREQARKNGRVSLQTRRRFSGEHIDASQLSDDWQPLGPGNVGGRVRAIVIDPGNAAVIYAATATGGVWKTTDGGNSWLPLTDFLPVLSTSSLVMDPSNSQTLYLGTGEYQLWGNGIYKTTDGGQTWNALPATLSTPGTGSFENVNQIAIPASQPSHLYAATGSGLFASTDGGVTWQQTSAGFFCNSVVARGDQPTDVVFAACRNDTGSFAIYRNTDAAGSGTWQIVQSDTNMFNTVLAIAPSQQSTIYALSGSLTAPFMYALYAVFQSTSNGDAGSWVKKADTSNPSTVTANLLSYANCNSTDHHGQAYYDLVLAVDPTNSNTVFVGGIDVFRSDDGGANFGDLGWLPEFHVDQHAIAFAPGYNGTSNQVMFIGTDGGVFQTSNALGGAITNYCTETSALVQWSNLNNGLAATQFYYGTIYPGGAAYFGGSQDNGTSFGSTAYGNNNWTYLVGGDGGQVMTDPLNSNNLFVEAEVFQLFKSADGGLTGNLATSGINDTGFDFITDFTYDPNDPLTMYVGGNQLWRTSDGANSWTAVSAPLASGATISVAAVDPTDSNAVYFSASDGGVYSSFTALEANGSTVWNGTFQGSGGASSFAFDPHAPGRIYVTYPAFRYGSGNAQIYRSNDRGVTWTPLGNGPGGLPDIPVSSLVVDPDNSSTLYASTDIGIFASYDGGATWTQATAPFADAEATTLKLEREGSSKVLYVFTFGRGVWKLNLDNGAPCTYSLSTTAVNAPSDGASGAITVNTSPGCPWTVQKDVASGAYGFVTIEGPANGNGTGQFYYDIPYNQYQPSSISQTVYVQGTPITFSQSGPPVYPRSVQNYTLSQANPIGSLPYGDLFTWSSYSASVASTPSSCAGSTVVATAWYVLSAPQSGDVAVSATGQTNAGMAITVYPMQGQTPGTPIACSVSATSSSFSVGTVATHFTAQSGQSYAIEISIQAQSFYSVNLAVQINPAVTITPATPQLIPGQSIQFSAAVANVPNQNVRWSISPLGFGRITPTGIYTPLATVNGTPQVTITATTFAQPQQTASLTLTITAVTPFFPPNGITSAASFQNGPIAPGEIITIFGINIGPPNLAHLQVDAAGLVATSTGGTQVTFDGVPAPIIYSLSGQLAAVVPYEVAGQASTQVAVSYGGGISQSVTVPVAASSPALFTLNASGQGPAAALNQDYHVNGPSHPAAAGSFVSLYGTGEGQTTPAGIDGALATGSVLPKPNLPVTVTIGNQPAHVIYAGAAPFDVAGVLQIDVTIPAGLSPGPQPVVVTVGTSSSPAGVTINVQGN